MKNDLDKQDRAISQLYRTMATEHSPHGLDQKILAAAKQELRATPRSPFAGHWVLPMSFAAVVLASVGLVTLMPSEPPLTDEISDLDKPNISHDIAFRGAAKAPNIADQLNQLQDLIQNAQWQTAKDGLADFKQQHPTFQSFYLREIEQTLHAH